MWPLPGCDSPTGLAIDAERHRLFSVCQNKVMVVTDADSGKQVARVPIGEHPDAAAYDAQRQRVFSSNGEGTLSIIRQESADRYGPADTLATQRGARTLALDAATGRVYLVTAEVAPAPAPTPAAAAPAGAGPHARPQFVPGSFVVLQVGAP